MVHKAQIQKEREREGDRDSRCAQTDKDNGKQVSELGKQHY